MSGIPSWTTAPHNTFGELRFIQGSTCVQRYIELPALPEVVDAFLTEAVSYASSGFDVFYGLNPRNKQRGRKLDVAACTALFVDADGAENTPNLTELREKDAWPSAIVSSGHGQHLDRKSVV